MLITKLKNKLLDYQSTADRIAYPKQRNFCVSLLQKEKIDFANFNVKR